MADQSQQLASRIQDEHERLKNLISEIRADLARSIDPEAFSDWKLEFTWRIRDFRNELTKHFDLEEDGGFMEDVIERAPRFAPRVEQLGHEHVDAVAQLEEITSGLKQMGVFDAARWSDVKKKIIGLFDSLEEHEAAERDLILEVYFQDIGVAD